MCKYFSKNEDQSSLPIKQATIEASEIKMHHNTTMKTITKSNGLCSGDRLSYFARIRLLSYCKFCTQIFQRKQVYYFLKKIWQTTR